MMTMEAIRAQYPAPQAQARTTAEVSTQVYVYDAYCVGGAVCRAAGIAPEYRHFPGQAHISRALQHLNAALDPQSANNYAADIIASNDGERFAVAWEFVDAALTTTETTRY